LFIGCITAPLAAGAAGSAAGAALPALLFARGAAPELPAIVDRDAAMAPAIGPAPVAAADMEGSVEFPPSPHEMVPTASNTWVSRTQRLVKLAQHTISGIGNLLCTEQSEVRRERSVNLGES
jgi:hypothetical protein